MLKPAIDVEQKPKEWLSVVRMFQLPSERKKLFINNDVQGLWKKKIEIRNYALER